MSQIFVVISMCILLIGMFAIAIHYHLQVNKMIKRCVKRICKHTNMSLEPNTLRLHRIRCKSDNFNRPGIEKHYRFTVRYKGESFQGNLMIFKKQIESCFIEKPHTKRREAINLKKAANEECNVIPFPST